MSSELKILPIDVGDQSNPLPYPMFNVRTGARVLVCAPSFSGKTVMIANLLSRKCYGLRDYYTTPEGVLNYFVISPTVHTDPTWVKTVAHLGLPKAHLFDHYSDAVVERIRRYSEKSPRGCFLVLDDIASDSSAVSSYKDTGVTHTFIAGRHSRLNVLLSVQMAIKCPPACRLNATHIIAFKVANKRERQCLLEQYLGDLDDAEAKYDWCVQRHRYGFIYYSKASREAFFCFERKLE